MGLMKWILEKLNGWKSILGYVIKMSAEFIQSHYPDFPAAEYMIVAEYIGESLLLIGLAHKGVKEVKAK